MVDMLQAYEKKGIEQGIEQGMNKLYKFCIQLGNSHDTSVVNVAEQYEIDIESVEKVLKKFKSTKE